jgi:hypothetical protein
VSLRLRPLRLDDEAEFQTAQVELLADGFTFGFIRDDESFAEHVERLERQRRGIDLGELVSAGAATRRRSSARAWSSPGHTGSTGCSSHVTTTTPGLQG